MNIIQWGSKYIDFRIGMIGSVIMGLMVFGINYYETAETYGIPNVLGSTTAAVKQGFFTLFFGGAVMRFSEYLATSIEGKYMAIITSSITPSVSSILLLFIIHSLKGTPEPLLSILPTVIFIVPTTAVWGINKRRKMKLHFHNPNKDSV